MLQHLTPKQAKALHLKNRCRHCEKALRPVKWADGTLGYGYMGRGHFCSLRCGWRFAIDAIEDNEGTSGGSLARRPR
jgi:hypothetical protein